MPGKSRYKLAAAIAAILAVLIASIYLTQLQLKTLKQQATPSQQPTPSQQQQTNVRSEEVPHTWWIQLVDRNGQPLAGETVYFAVHNLTDGRLLLAVEGVTDTEGRISFAITALPATGNYNVIAAVHKCNRWMLLHQAEVDWKQLINDYVNRTLVANRWLLLRLTVVADLDGDGLPEPLKLPHGNLQLRILWPEGGAPIAEIAEYPENGTASAPLGISDTVIEFSDGTYVTRRTALLAEARWLINGTGIRIGSRLIEVDRALLEEKALVDVPIYVHGRRYAVRIVNPCGPSIDVTNWTFSLRANVEGKFVEICSGAPERSCWLPDITREHGTPVTLVVQYLGAQMLAVNFSTTEINATLGKRVALVTEAGRTRIDVGIPLVDVTVKVLDSRPVPTPLAGARIEIIPPVGAPLQAYTNVQGVALVRQLIPDIMYTVKIYYIWPGSRDWIDVTPSYNTFTISADDAVQGGCPVYTFTFQAKIYEARLRVVDLCGEGVSPATYPGLYLLVYRGNATVGVAALGKDGTAFLPLPGGRLRFRLYYKGVLMTANTTSLIEPEIELAGNAEIILQYPIGNLRIRITRSSNGGAACGLNVKLQYLRDGRLVYEEPVQLTDCQGTVTFTKVPLRPLIDLEKRIKYELRIIAFTAANVIVNKTIPFELLEPSCTSVFTISD